MSALPVPRAAKSAHGTLRSARSRTLILILGIIILVLLAALSLFVGSGRLSVAQTWAALTGGQVDATGIIVRDYRVPRTILALIVGAGLGASGALIQAITRNPLADPGILGVNAGSYLCVVIGAAFFGAGGTLGQVWWALGGALVTSVAVYLIGTAGRHGASPVQLVLTGVALGAIFTGISSAITLLTPEAFDKLRFWAAGSLQGRQMDTVIAVAPFLILGLLIALTLSSSLNALALGDEVARSLGTRVALLRAVSIIVITVLCGASTAAVGPIGFLGLMAPHAVRSLVGPDQRWVIPLSMIGAPIIFLSADMIGRVLVQSELPVGIVTAFLGAPILIWLVRRKEAKGL